MRGGGHWLICAALCTALLITSSARADEAIWRNHMNTAAEAAKRGDHAAAAQMYDAALRQSTVFGDSDARVAATYFGLAQAQRAQHTYEAAEKNYLQALAILESVNGAAHQRSASVLNALGDLYRVQGRYPQAES